MVTILSLVFYGSFYNNPVDKFNFDIIVLINGYLLNDGFKKLLIKF